MAHGKDSARGEIALTNHSATCWHKDCQNAGTVWSHFQWWCAAHSPSSLPDPACTHSLTNVHYGIEVCSWCCGHLTDIMKGTG